MASIIKRPDRGYYVVRWREGEEQRSRKVTDLATAKRLQREIEECIATGKRWEPATARPIPDLGEILVSYARSCVRRLKPRTAELYAERLDVFTAWLKTTDPRRRKWTPDVLSRSLLEQFYDWLLEPTGRHGHPRKPVTARKYVSDVEVFWQWAYDHDEEWPDQVPRPRPIVRDIPADPPPITLAPTWAEMDACIAHAAGWQRQLAIVLRYTGLRVDQAMRLTWDDVDLERAELHVRPELGKSRQERRGRFVPITQHLADELAGWGVREGFLVPCGRQAGPREREARGRDLARAWRRAGVRETIWKAHPHHCFRKGFHSGLLSLGAPFPHVEFLVGHTLVGSADPYVDPTIAYDLRRTVALIPKVEPVIAAVFPRCSPERGTEKDEPRKKGRSR